LADNNQEGVYMQIFDKYAERIGSNILINESTLNNQTEPFISPLLNGSYIVTWIHMYNMHGCFTDLNGNQVCNTTNVEKAMFDIYDFDRLVNEFTYNNQKYIRIEALYNGNFVFSYQSKGKLSINNDIYFKILDKNKNIIKKETLMNMVLPEESHSPRLIVFKDFFIYLFKTYKSNTCYNIIQGGKFDYSGNRINEETDLTICNTNYGYINYYMVKKYFEDKFIMIFEQTGSSYDKSSDCYFKVFSTNFTVIKDITKVSINIDGNQTSPDVAIIENPKQNSHKIAMTWTTDWSNDSTGKNIKGIIYNSDYSIAKGEFTVNTYKTNDQNYSRILYLKNTEGKFLIVYRSYRIVNQEIDIAGQIFDYNGNKISVEIVVNNYKNLNQYFINVISTEKNIYVLWVGKTPQDKNELGIGVTKLDYDLKFINEYYPNKLDIGQQDVPYFTVSSTGQVVIGWESDQGDARGTSLQFEYLEVCPDEYFADPNDNYICKPCDFSCVLGCSQFSDYCTLCKSGALRKIDDNNRCYFNPPLGYYSDSSNTNIWSKCDISCRVCLTSPINCTHCQVDYLPYVDNATRCGDTNSPPVGYFHISPNEFLSKCDISCSTCEISEENCTECNILENYYYLEDIPNTCTNTKTEGYYFNTVAKIWSLCDDSCASCSDSASNCSTCKSGYFILEDKPSTCKNTQTDGYYFNTDDENWSQCDVSCATCTDNPSNCLSCKSGYFFFEDKPNTCTNTKTEGYYLNTVAKIWSLCDDSCASCSDSASNCSTCKSGYFILEDKPSTCKNTKKDGYYFNSDTQIWSLCDVSCATCNDKTNKCTKCNYKNGYFRINHDDPTCLNECPDKYWRNYIKEECSSCDNSCKKCFDESLICKVNKNIKIDYFSINSYT